MTRKALIVGLLLSLQVTLGNSKAGAQKTPAASTTCQPREGTNACETCHENRCCTERRACETEPACAAFLDCLRNSCATPPCNGKCGTAPATYVARFACQMAKCNVEACGGPVDACTLCASTHCAKEVISCLNHPGCAEYLDCVKACGKKPGCVNGCKQPSADLLAAAKDNAACTKKHCDSACGPAP